MRFGIFMAHQSVNGISPEPYRFVTARANLSLGLVAFHETTVSCHIRLDL
ncbi:MULTISPECIES: hypothetical protein [unclassified Veillonella]|nr:MULTISPECIES: hypothetical protein [unclassified Veillonella]